MFKHGKKAKMDKEFTIQTIDNNMYDKSRNIHCRNRLHKNIPIKINYMQLLFLKKRKILNLQTIESMRQKMTQTQLKRLSKKMMK